MGTAFLTGQSGVDKSIKRGMLISSGTATSVPSYGTTADLVSIDGKGTLKFLSIRNTSLSAHFILQVSIDGQAYEDVGCSNGNNDQFSLLAGYGVFLPLEVKFKTQLKVRGKMVSNDPGSNVKCFVGWFGG